MCSEVPYNRCNRANHVDSELIIVIQSQIRIPFHFSAFVCCLFIGNHTSFDLNVDPGYVCGAWTYLKQNKHDRIIIEQMIKIMNYRVNISFLYRTAGVKLRCGRILFNLCSPFPQQQTPFCNNQQPCLS